MRKQLLDSLFPDTRQQLLARLLMDSERKWYLSELARHLELTPSTLQRELTSLSESGVLLRTRDGNRAYYQANRRCPIYEELRSIFVKTVGLVDQVRDSLESIGPGIRWAFVFGSIVTEEERSSSDVDLLIIGKASLTDIAIALKPLETRLGRSVNPVLYTEDEYQEKLEVGSHFLSAVLASPKLFIIGSESDLAATTELRTGSAASNQQTGA